MNNSKDKFWLAFASIEELGASFIEKLYNHFGCIENAWTISSSEIVEIEGITKKQISYFLDKRKNVKVYFSPVSSTTLNKRTEENF